MATCFSPELAPGFFEPRSRFNSAVMPDCLPSMAKRPIRVSLMTSAAAMQPIMASQSGRRACSQGSTAWM